MTKNLRKYTAEKIIFILSKIAIYGTYPQLSNECLESATMRRAIECYGNLLASCIKKDVFVRNFFSTSIIPFNADLDPYPAFHSNADPDPQP
jgi:hypothetical protein